MGRSRPLWAQPPPAGPRVPWVVPGSVAPQGPAAVAPPGAPLCPHPPQGPTEAPSPARPAERQVSLACPLLSPLNRNECPTTGIDRPVLHLKCGTCWVFFAICEAVNFIACCICGNPLILVFIFIFYTVS